MACFLVIFVSVLALLSKGHADLIGDLCTKSNNPSLCDQALRSDPRSAGANARGLAGIALDKADAATKSSIEVAKSIVVYPVNKDVIHTCVEVFSDAVDNLEQSKPLLRKGDPGSTSDMQTKGSAALTDIDTCSEEYGSKEPAKLKDATSMAYTFVQLFLIIVNAF